MKTIVRYQCEVCGNQFTTASMAHACEDQPPVARYPRGLIFGSCTGFYKNITFVIAENDVHGHFNNPAMWAFRDNGAGDSRDLQDLCGSTNQTRLCKADAAKKDHPTFHRAVAFLKKHGIPASVWDGKQAIAFS